MHEPTSRPNRRTRTHIHMHARSVAARALYSANSSTRRRLQPSGPPHRSSDTRSGSELTASSHSHLHRSYHNLGSISRRPTTSHPTSAAPHLQASHDHFYAPAPTYPASPPSQVNSSRRVSGSTGMVLRSRERRRDSRQEPVYGRSKSTFHDYDSKASHAHTQHAPKSPERSTTQPLRSNPVSAEAAIASQMERERVMREREQAVRDLERRERERASREQKKQEKLQVQQRERMKSEAAMGRHPHCTERHDAQAVVQEEEKGSELPLPPMPFVSNRCVRLIAHVPGYIKCRCLYLTANLNIAGCRPLLLPPVCNRCSLGCT